MYNYQKIQTNKYEEMLLFFIKADITKGKKGKKLKTIAQWLLEEEY